MIYDPNDKYTNVLQLTITDPEGNLYCYYGKVDRDTLLGYALRDIALRESAIAGETLTAQDIADYMETFTYRTVRNANRYGNLVTPENAVMMGAHP